MTTGSHHMQIYWMAGSRGGLEQGSWTWLIRDQRWVPGEAIYLPAGELHSYLKGVGIELMANSDNVLRGGLTPKHVDVAELLKIVKFETSKIDTIKPVVCGNCEQIYPTPAEEFQLSVLSVEKGSCFVSPRIRGVEILICLKGEAFIKEIGRAHV